MNKNEIVLLDITDIGTDGEGIGKIDGFTLFVKDAVPGDTIEAKIVKLKKNYGYGRVERVIKPSPFRVNPPCEHARRCGGCQIMEMNYQKQLEFKENKVKNNLIRIGGFDASYIDEIMEPIVGVSTEEISTLCEDELAVFNTPLRYRNKAQYPIGYDKEGNLIAGFYAGRTHSIISCEDCKLGVVYNSDILKIILKHMTDNKITAYNEESHTGLVRHVLIRKGFATGEIMVCIVINGNAYPKYESLCDELAKIDGMTSISISINKDKTNVIMGDNYHTLWGRDTIKDVMRVRKPILKEASTIKEVSNELNNSNREFLECYSEKGNEFEISPLSFYQVNPIQVEKLYGVAIDYADLKPEDEVWDICCGIGTITLAMAPMCKKVHGIEIVPQAIEDAKANAIRNNITNVEFICAPAEEYLPAHKSDIKADVIVMDPPRKGMDEKAMQVVVNAEPKKIVYVSCDSATLARDLKYLCENGYRLKRVRACDMFSQSVHVETCVLITRDKKCQNS